MHGVNYCSLLSVIGDRVVDLFDIASLEWIPVWVPDRTSFETLAHMPIVFPQLICSLFLCFLVLETVSWLQDIRTLIIRRRSPGKALSHTLPIWMIVIILAGWVSTEIASQYMDTSKRENMMTQARILAETLPTSEIRKLDGVIQDLHTPVYQDLKKHLGHLRSANTQYYYIYLMAVKNGKIVFLVEAGPPSYATEDEVPGTLYEDAPVKLWNCFRMESLIPKVPIQMNGGYGSVHLFRFEIPERRSWFSVLGCDIVATDWNRSIYFARLPVILVILLIMILTVFFFLVQQASRDRELRISSSEIRYKALVEGSPHAIILLNRD